MDVHMRYHPRYISETIAIQQRQQYLLVQQQIIAEQRMLTIQKEMTLAEENAEECRAQAKRILMERQRRDPEFAYRMQDPVYAQHKLREMIYAVWRDRTVRAGFICYSHSAHAVTECIM